MNIIEHNKNGLVYLTADGFEAAGGVAHGFSTRLGGVSEGIYATLNLGMNRGDAPDRVRENYRRFCAAIGADMGNIVCASQVHGDTVRTVTAADLGIGLDEPEPWQADGLVTDIPGVTLAVYSADCLPILRIVKEENPEVLMKCVKNAAEIENIRRGHIKDGVAHTKFMYWLKKHAGKETITELSASEKLENFRKEQEGYLWPSFDPICAYGQHAAIVHYSSTPETNVELKEGGLFLTDTGGNYYDGSTDITRTVAIGEVDEKQKEDFTMVACSMLRLADAKFLAGCSGMVLDYAAREPFWRRNLNYNHGTGHGVGYLGNIHEAPIGFRWKATRDAMCEIEPGMVITNEPGIYIEGSHGIRIENELLVRAGEKNEYGQFLYFEPLTFVPIDLDALRPELMTEEEKQLLNAYHQSVYEKISPYLEAEEKEWLKEYTRPVK